MFQGFLGSSTAVDEPRLRAARRPVALGDLAAFASASDGGAAHQNGRVSIVRLSPVIKKKKRHITSFSSSPVFPSPRQI